MRKLALLLAAALIVSAPLVAASTSTTYAAAKKATKAKKEEKKVDPNAAFWMALGDLAGSVGKPSPAKDDGKSKGKAKKAKKA